VQSESNLRSLRVIDLYLLLEHNSIIVAVTYFKRFGFLPPLLMSRLEDIFLFGFFIASFVVKVVNIFIYDLIACIGFSCR